MTRKSSSVTIRDVARHAAVSVATVSRFINRTAPVSQEVAERIQQVMLDLNYKPHVAARQLATRRTLTVGLVIHNMHTDFFAPLLSGIEAVVSENQYNLLVATYDYKTHHHRPLPIGPHNTDGLLSYADCLNEEQLTDLCRVKFPVVLIHRTAPPQLRVPFVTVENKAATYKLISHLIETHGRRSIIFLRGPHEQEDSRWREQGYRDALEEHGISFNPDLMLCGEFNRHGAYTALKKFLARRHPPFDAIFSGDDDAAIGVYKALREAGLRIPEDVSVVGFDDARLSTFLNPPLTTVRAPTQLVGQTAASILFDLLQERTVETCTLLSTEIVLRRSCGCTYENPGEPFQDVVR
ncbi:MAG: LacI family transcriptional regulator [Anaerolineae bacterium]|nr:MAG: LacI family transcriptional regulator [Anaerolineae bacterium]